ncbi:hypothetical protein J4734_14855, partial [Klebsiella pneumoniae]|nr:hypothetical protein [Klebsiella pneumoniae]
ARPPFLSFFAGLRVSEAPAISDFPALRTIACGAGHLSDGLIKELKTLFPHTAIQPIYGLETTSPATIFRATSGAAINAAVQVRRSRGSSLPSATIASSPPAGQIGHIWLKAMW